MSKKRFVFAVFSVLILGLLLFAIWSNIHVYAQQQPPQSRAADSVTPELKAKMCNPGNPSLKVVNATESRICGIPRTVKLHTASAATPSTSSVSSSVPQQTTTTTKPTSVASVSTHHPHAKQQHITNANANVTSQETNGVIGSKIAPATHLTNSLSSSPSSSPSGIAPRVKAVNQPQQHQTPITRINGTTAVNNATTGHEYTFTSTTPTSGKTMYLGYPGYKSNLSNPDSSSTDKSDSNIKPSSHSTRSATTTTTVADTGSTDKKQSSTAATTTKSDNTRTMNIDGSNQISKSRSSNSHTQDSDSTTTKTSRLPSDLASAITNKVHSFIRNSMKGLIHKTPFILPFH